jgi:hypothetical protein
VWAITDADVAAGARSNVRGGAFLRRDLDLAQAQAYVNHLWRELAAAPWVRSQTGGVTPQLAAQPRRTDRLQSIAFGLAVIAAIGWFVKPNLITVVGMCAGVAAFIVGLIGVSKAKKRSANVQIGRAGYIVGALAAAFILQWSVQKSMLIHECEDEGNYDACTELIDGDY